MTKEQTKTMIEYFKSAYGEFYDADNIRNVLMVWYEVFMDEDPQIVSQAAKNFVRTSEFPPTIAGLKKQIDLIKNPSTETDLWSLINKAAARGLYHAEEEFAKLPPECQSFIGCPEALKDLAQADVGTMNTVVKGQFLKRVEAIRTHQEVQRGLPDEVRQAIENSQRMLEMGEVI